MGDLTDLTNERELPEDDDDIDEDEHCIDCGRPIDYCICGKWLSDD